MFYINSMREDDVSNLDLNLLKSLGALLETSSVSKAAEQTNLSQPAMSRSLNRLQHVMKDPLLVRSGRGMVLTPRGEALRGPVQEALTKVSVVFAPHTFDPSKARDRFRIMAPDYLAQLIIPGVLSQVFNAAPGVQIEMENLSETAVADMCAGKLSLGFGVVHDGPVLENVASQALFTDRQMCLMRKGHHLAGSALGLTDYASASHALLSITGKGGGRIDEILKTHGLARTISMRVAHFLTISELIASTNLIIAVPELLARQVLTDDLIQMELPKELQMPSFTVSQIWHVRFTGDPAHQWLRRMIKRACTQHGQR